MSTKFEKSVIAAITAFEKGSAKVVRLFENAVDFYHENGDQAQLSFILNALVNHKVIQKSAVSIAKRYFSGELKLNNGVVTVTPKKWGEGKKAKAIEKFAEFKAKDLNSFLNDGKVENAIMFALDKRLKGMENSITKLFVDAIANGEDPQALVQALNKTIVKIANTDLSDKVSEAKEKAAKAKEAENDSDAVAEVTEETPVVEAESVAA